MLRSLKHNPLLHIFHGSLPAMQCHQMCRRQKTNTECALNPSSAVLFQVLQIGLRCHDNVPAQAGMIVTKKVVLAAYDLSCHPDWPLAQCAGHLCEGLQVSRRNRRARRNIAGASKQMRSRGSRPGLQTSAFAFGWPTGKGRLSLCWPVCPCLLLLRTVKGC